MQEQLQKLFNLSEKEALVYLKLLELGEATIQRISEVTGINRLSLYDLFESLIKKGVAGSTVKEKVKHFYVIEPKKLLNRLKEAEKEFSSILPQLEKRKESIGLKPKVLFFEGIKGIDVVNEDVLKSKEIMAYGSFDIPNRMLEWQTIDFLKKRLRLGIKWKGVTDIAITKQDFYKKQEYQKLTEVKIDDSLKEMPVWIYIYNNKVAILSFKKESFNAIIIEDEAVNQAQRIIFEKLWKQAK